MDINDLVTSFSKLSGVSLEATLKNLDIARDIVKQRIEKNKNDNLEREKVELLQRDQNIGSDIASLKSQISSLNEKIKTLELERENIHRRWIEINPVKKNNDVTQSIDTSIDNILNTLKNIAYPGVARKQEEDNDPFREYTSVRELFCDVFGVHKEFTPADIKEFKKFDNLIKRRCNTSIIYGEFYTRVTLINKMNAAQQKYANMF